MPITSAMGGQKELTAQSNQNYELLVPRACLRAMTGRATCLPVYWREILIHPNSNNKDSSQSWWHKFVIPTFGQFKDWVMVMSYVSKNGDTHMHMCTHTCTRTHE